MRVLHEPLLKKLTTLHLGGNALAMLLPEEVADFEQIPIYLKKLGGKAMALGRGSNLLVQDGELGLVLISLKELAKIEILGQRGEMVQVRAQAGVPLARLLRYCMTRGLSGLEGLAGVPGSVGGACAMNAGSFGTTIGDMVDRIEIWTPAGLEEVGRDKLNFAYRNCGYLSQNNGVYIVSVIFTLTQGEKGGIFKRMNLNYFKKKTRQPLGSWSAGCAFKNPVSGPGAGILLDKAGMRGYRSGGMAFSPLHANFLINEGEGSSEAALELLEKARSKVKKEFDVDLELEVRIIPCL